jgi:hypothetical protein
MPDAHDIRPGDLNGLASPIAGGAGDEGERGPQRCLRGAKATDRNGLLLFDEAPLVRVHDTTVRIDELEAHRHRDGLIG